MGNTIANLEKHFCHERASGTRDSNFSEKEEEKT